MVETVQHLVRLLMTIYFQQSLGKQEVNKSRETEGFNQILQALATKMGDEDKCQMICDPKPRVQTSIQASL